MKKATTIKTLAITAIMLSSTAAMAYCYPTSICTTRGSSQISVEKNDGHKAENLLISAGLLPLAITLDLILFPTGLVVTTVEGSSDFFTESFKIAKADAVNYLAGEEATDNLLNLLAKIRTDGKGMKDIEEATDEEIIMTIALNEKI